MPNIYLYVPCNGTQYFTSANISSSSFVIYNDTNLDSYKYGDFVYTTFANRALIITNNSSDGLPLDYTVEWWQRNASTTGSAAASMMFSNGTDDTKLQLQDKYNTSSSAVTFTFENALNGTRKNLSNSVSVINSDWTHFAYVFSLTNQVCYYFTNGTYTAANSFSYTDSVPNMYMFCIGGKSSSTTYASEFFTGDISDVIITDGIKYAENTSFTPPSSPDTTGLIAYGSPSYIPIPDGTPHVITQGPGRLNGVWRNNKLYLIGQEDE